MLEHCCCCFFTSSSSSSSSTLLCTHAHIDTDMYIHMQAFVQMQQRKHMYSNAAHGLIHQHSAIKLFTATLCYVGHLFFFVVCSFSSFPLARNAAPIQFPILLFFHTSKNVAPFQFLYTIIIIMKLKHRRIHNIRSTHKNWELKMQSKTHLNSLLQQTPNCSNCNLQKLWLKWTSHQNWEE